MTIGLYYTRGTQQASIPDILLAAFVRQTVSSNTTLTTSANQIIVTGNTTLTLPTAIGITGFTYIIFKNDSNATTVTVNTTGGQTINGHASVTFSPQFYVFIVQSDGSNWIVLQNTQALA